MDSITHIVLGACIGEVIAGKKLGRKAMLFGAIGNSLPDIDIVGSLWLDTASDLLFHRGITHSFLFVALMGPLLGWLSKRWDRRSDMSLKHWIFFWTLEILVHLIIDSFTAYGTGWFEPFSQARVSFNLVFVLDPLFSLGPLIGAIVLLFLKQTSRRRVAWAAAGIALCGLYTGINLVNKTVVDGIARKAFAAKSIRPQKYFTTPTPINNVLWYVVAVTDSGYYLGYRSMLDMKEGIDLRFVPRRDSLLRLATERKTLENLLRFSQGYYTLELQRDSLVFSDMRFGEIGTWVDEEPKFVFYYHLLHPKANDMVVQRRRMAMADKKMLRAFAKRVMGL